MKGKGSRRDAQEEDVNPGKMADGTKYYKAYCQVHAGIDMMNEGELWGRSPVSRGLCADPQGM
jgi:hypothetical protein